MGPGRSPGRSFWCEQAAIVAAAMGCLWPHEPASHRRAGSKDGKTKASKKSKRKKGSDDEDDDE